jgi:hypothetical protein
MKKFPKKSRAELHLEFIRECKIGLDKKNVEETHHLPVDQEIKRDRKSEIQVGDLIKYKRKVGRVKIITGQLIVAVEVNTQERFRTLIELVKKL